MSGLRGAASLWRREVVRFLRQPSRVVGTVAPPLLFWVVLGSGLSGVFHLPGQSGDYRAYFFPGTAVLVVMFAAIFATISLIEDRQAGFLQSVLVSPLPRWAIVAGKVLGGATLALLQGLVLLPLAPTVGLAGGLTDLVMAAGVLAALAFAFAAIGFAFAWRMDSVQGFHAVMNLVLMPLWMLSGAVFPAAGAPGWLQLLMRLDPLTYGVDALRAALAGGPAAVPIGGAVFGLVALGTLAFGVDVALVRRGDRP